AGMRPISNVVDVTNYAMLALGNPLHAFDSAKLHEGRIVVRRARKGEQLRTLDGVMRELEETDLMIADADRAVALAGIMGGEETEIGDATTDVLLEAANFEPYAIFRTSERLRLRTEGSNRWEKGVDPHVAPQAAAPRDGRAAGARPAAASPRRGRPDRARLRGGLHAVARRGGSGPRRATAERADLRRARGAADDAHAEHRGRSATERAARKRAHL